MSNYRVIRKQERWVETIVLEASSPEQALKETDDWETDWELAGLPVFTGLYEVRDWDTDVQVLVGYEEVN